MWNVKSNRILTDVSSRRLQFVVRASRPDFYEVRQPEIAVSLSVKVARRKSRGASKIFAGCLAKIFGGPRFLSTTLTLPAVSSLRLRRKGEQFPPFRLISTPFACRTHFAIHGRFVVCPALRRTNFYPWRLGAAHLMLHAPNAQPNHLRAAPSTKAVRLHPPGGRAARLASRNWSCPILSSCHSLFSVLPVCLRLAYAAGFSSAPSGSSPNST